MSETIVVIGAGHGAAQLVESLRTGGCMDRIVLIGDEPFRPYERPATSKDLLSGAMDLDRVFLKRETFYDDKQIELRLATRVTAIDRAAKTVTLGDGEVLPYDRLVIATGARARRLQVPGVDLDGVFTLRTLADSRAIGERLGPGKRLAIVGGGYVGLEVAASARKLGCEVTVIEMQERLLARVVAGEVARFYQTAHRDAGVALHFGVVIQEFVGEGSVRCVRLTDGAEIPADVVVIGVGAIPNTELAAEAGLAVETASSSMSAAAPPIRRSMRSATRPTIPTTCSANASDWNPSRPRWARPAPSPARSWGAPKPFHEIPWFWSDQYDLKLQIVGLSELGDDVVIRGDPATRRFAAFYLRQGVVVAVNAISSGKDFIGGKKLVAERRKPDPARLADQTIPLSEV